MKKTATVVTSEGEVPHKWHPAGFWMPVALDVDPSKARQPQPPIRAGGRLVYALPGRKYTS